MNSPVGARPIIRGLVELTRSADSIVQGTVTDVRDAALTVRVAKVLKGGTSPREITIRFDPTRTTEVAPPRVAAGEEVLLFLGPPPDAPAPVGNGQGIVTLAPQTTAKYIRTIELLLEFDRASDRIAKQGALKKMLTMNFGPAALEALKVIYTESVRGGFATDQLVATVSALAQRGETPVRVNAAQVLGRIGDKAQVPVLIELLGDSDPAVAETAFATLKSLTRGEPGFDKGSASTRRAAMDEWRAWWRENKDQVVLVK